MYIMIIFSFNFIITYVKEMVYVDYTSMIVHEEIIILW